LAQHICERAKAKQRWKDAGQHDNQSN